MKGLNGHTDFTSANTLRNSVKNAINLDGQFDRFKPSLNGGHFSNTYWNETTLKKNVSKNSFFIDFTILCYFL